MAAMRRSMSSGVNDSGSDADTASRSVISCGTGDPVASICFSGGAISFATIELMCSTASRKFFTSGIRGIDALEIVGDVVGVAESFELGQVVPQLSERAIDHCPPSRGHA